MQLNGLAKQRIKSDPTTNEKNQKEKSGETKKLAIVKSSISGGIQVFIVKQHSQIKFYPIILL